MIDVHMGRIRAKLRAISDRVPLETVRRRGFVWKDEPDEEDPETDL